MSLYDDYEKQVEKTTKDFQDRAQKIHDDAMRELDKQTKDAMLNFFYFLFMFIALVGVAGLVLSAFGLLHSA